MATSTSEDSGSFGVRTDWLECIRNLGPRFAERAPVHDADDSFVADNYRELKELRVFSAGIPEELGGGGATHAELCAMLREVGHWCGSTAVALSMHTHLLGNLVWRFRQGQPVESILSRIVEEQLVLVTSGASDWLSPIGKAERVEGGYRLTAIKRFGSGSVMGDLLLTTTPFMDPAEGHIVLHCAIPFGTDGVTVRDNWKTMMLRGTASNDIELDNVFVPDSAIALRRPWGRWHPSFNVAVCIAAPVYSSAYLGIAEAARELAVRYLHGKRDDRDVWALVGELENSLVTAQLVVQAMIDLSDNYAFPPVDATANAMLIRKSIAAQALLSTGEKALEAVGGGGVFRALGLERLVRDLHGVQFHPLPAKKQQTFSGRMALGLDPVE